ncbi:hypothetical protein HMI56_006682 [Coelomomyces lativittatus]|nr:hypothetical protein HMI56_006682 [Coelomomyces lativittatus]
MPVCSHCSNNVEFELYECQEICPQCGTVASSECLTNNVQFQAPSYPLQSTGYLDPSVKALYSIYPTTDSYTSNRVPMLQEYTKTKKIKEKDLF